MIDSESLNIDSLELLNNNKYEVKKGVVQIRTTPYNMYMLLIFN